MCNKNGFYYVYNLGVNFDNFLFRNIGLSSEMDGAGSVAAVETTVERITKQREELEQLWASRKLKLDLCLRLRLFERDALEVRTHSKKALIKPQKLKKFSISMEYLNSAFDTYYSAI